MEIKQFFDPIQLKEIADIETSEKLFQRLTPQELIDLKNELAEKQIFLAKRTGYLKNIQNSFKLLDSNSLLDELSKLEVVDFGTFGTQALKKQIQDIIVLLDEKGTHVESKIYGIYDYDDEIVIFYDSQGKYHYHRPLNDEERINTKLFTMKKINNE